MYYNNRKSSKLNSIVDNKKTFLTILALFILSVAYIGNIQQLENKNAQSQIDSAYALKTQNASYRTEQLKSQEQHVYDVCNDSRINTSNSKTVPEYNCGFLQDKYNMEFICKQNNNSVNNMCWVEYKGTNYNEFVKES